MLLAVDTSTRMMGIALYKKDQVIGEMLWQTSNFHTVELAPAIEYLFKRCDTQPAALQALAVALGPGSFTGLRIGLSLIKGMARGLKLPVIGIPTLKILTAAQPASEMPLAAVLQAGRGRLAVGWYQVEGGRWQLQGEYQVLKAEELAKMIQQPTLVCGELSAEEQKVLTRKYRTVHLASPAQAVRRPALLAELAWERLQANDVDDAATLSPIYLHTGEQISG